MPYTVKGVVAHSKGSPVEVTDIVVPDPGPGEALVDVRACGVCHTDLHYREGGIADEFPFLLGHEAAGVVSAVGNGVTEMAPGDFVILNWRAVCGRCRACAKGRPWYRFNTLNAARQMTLTDGTPLSPSLGIGAFAKRTLVHAGQCTRVDPAAPATAVERGVVLPAPYEIGVGDEGPADGDEVGLAGRHTAAGGGGIGHRVPAVADDERPAEPYAEVQEERVGRVADGVQIGEPQGRDAVDQRPVCGGGLRRVVLDRAVKVDAGGDPDADPLAADRLGHRVGQLDDEAGPGGGGAAVGVGAVVGGGGEEPVGKVSVGAVQFDTVQAGFDRRAGRVGVLADHGRHLRRLQGARYGVRPHAAGGEHLAGGGERAGRHGFVAVLVVGVGDAPRVHELGDYKASFRMDGVGDPAPALDLPGCVQARGVDVALPDRAGLDALADDRPAVARCR